MRREESPIDRAESLSERVRDALIFVITINEKIMKEFDAVIIGFGKGGKTLAADLAGRGRKVAVVERSVRMYGGTCINTGCIPTKTLVAQAKVADRMRGASFEERAAFYRKAIGVKEDVTGALRSLNYHNLADNPNITLLTGTGSFVSPDTVSVRTESGDEMLRSDAIFIDTGAETVIPPIEGLSGNPFVFTSTSIMELWELPRRLVIVGGGYIGLEFASIYASFGSEVTVLESFATLIPREDRDIAAAVEETLRKKGIAFHLGVQVREVRNEADHATVVLTDGAEAVFEIDADAVLIAAGRRPATEGLNLQAAGVGTDSRGAVVVDSRLRTTNPNIRALGDVKGGPQFTYISLDDYRIVRDDLFGGGIRSTEDRDPVPYSVFIDPPLSRIGMSEDEARKQGLDIVVRKLPVSSIPRMKTTGETDGLLKAVIDRGTGKILGCTLLAPESHEVINTVSVAMKAGLDHTFLRDFIFTHPSMSEALNLLFA